MPALFQTHAELYDALIDWVKRLANETPFYRALFAEAGVRRVLDAACGTGHHAGMFHAWGLEVEGADLSAEMIALCRRRFGEPERLRWVERSFETPADPPGSFDAVICVGNSLALATDLEAVRHAVGSLLQALRPGGVCVVQVLNLWRIPEGPLVWQKHLRVPFGGQDHVLLKGVHRVGGRGFVEIADLQLTPGPIQPTFETAQFWGIEADALANWARDAGATEIRTLGSFQGAPYDRSASTDLILACRRGSASS